MALQQSQTTASNGQPVIVNIDAKNTRMYEIVATLCMVGAFGMLAYSLAKNGWLEIGATGLTMFFVQMIRMMWNNGILRIRPSDKPDAEFKQTAGLLKTATMEFREWQARSPMWRLAALAGAYTVVFMTARWLMKQLMLVFTNVWVAGAFSLLLASVIIAPNLISQMISKTKSKNSRVVVDKSKFDHKVDTSDITDKTEGRIESVTVNDVDAEPVVTMTGDAEPEDDVPRLVVASQPDAREAGRRVHRDVW